MGHPAAEHPTQYTSTLEVAGQCRCAPQAGRQGEKVFAAANRLADGAEALTFAGESGRHYDAPGDPAAMCGRAFVELAMTVNGRLLCMCCGLSMVLAGVGCGLVEIERTIFPEQATNADGALLFIEDLQDVTEDANLLSDTMEDALSALGIESEDLVEAIVEDGLDAPTPSSPTPDDDNDGG
ncbi:MAG: hypothetical protein V3W34_00415 [Phycisphaerae bacterium]